MNAAESSWFRERTETPAKKKPPQPGRGRDGFQIPRLTRQDRATGGVSQSSKPVDKSDNGSEAERFQPQAAEQDRSLIFIAASARHPDAVITSEGVRDLIVRGIFGVTPSYMGGFEAIVVGRGDRFI